MTASTHAGNVIGMSQPAALSACVGHSEKLGEDEDDMQDGWRIAPSRLKACRDANGQPIELGRGAYGVVCPVGVSAS